MVGVWFNVARRTCLDCGRSGWRAHRAPRAWRACRCSKLQQYHQVLSGLIQLIVGGEPRTRVPVAESLMPIRPAAALQVSRVYAMYHSSRKVLASLVTLAVAGCVVCVVSGTLAEMCPWGRC